ncbi:DUF1941-domain-containing protein [Ascodesmis nigricans]|uniref:DUF1941-domain-containing protein n=1 Tax=Ascodesmis nigricans TaxID=341454 RepID=A0A4S2MWG0_9PEZI|nr:DUF1941-domain-containing protein [Ascodesmis nigricans]
MSPNPGTSSSVALAPVQDCLRCLARKDDTSRFVGLTMLLSLTRQLDQAQFHDLMLQCTQVLDGRFLDRLLKSGTSNAAMMELASHVMEALGTVLVASGDVQYLTDRIPSLVQALSASTNNTFDVILSTLLALSTIEKGATSIIALEDLSPLFAFFPISQTANRTILGVFSGAKHNNADRVRHHLQRLLEHISPRACQWDRAAAVSGFVTLDKVFKILAPEIIPTPGQWIQCIYDTLRIVSTSGNSLNDRTVCIGLAARLLEIASLDSVFSFTKLSDQKSRTSAFLFIQLVTIDLRAAYPKLAERLHSDEYDILSSEQSDRLDVLGKFLVFLLSLDDLLETGVEPDLILRLRGDMGESMVMTIEFLRDRWDDSNAELKGETASRLQEITDSRSATRAQDDPLVTAGVQTLAIWLKEEDSHHKEAAGITDIFLTLWGANGGQNTGFKHIILCALQALADEKEGRQQFLAHDGWTPLWNDIRPIYESLESRSSDDIMFAIDTARLICDILRFETVGHVSWAQQVINLLDVKAQSDALALDDLALQLQISLLHLASTCYVGARRAVSGSVEGTVRVDKLQTMYKNVLGRVQSMGKIPWIEQCLEEIAEDLRTR